MEELNNPAGRLRYWLERAHRQSGPALQAWGEVFGLDSESPRGRVEIIGRGAELMELAGQTRDEMDELPKEFHADALMADFDEVEDTLAKFVGLHQMQMHQFFAPLNGTGWRSLEHAARYLGTQRPETWINDDKRENLLDHVRRVVDVVLGSAELDEKVREFIIARLREVEQAIIDLKLRGTGDVERATDSLFAGILRRTGQGFDFFQTETGTKIAGLIFAIATVLGMGADYLAITDDSGQPVIEQHTDVNVEVIDGEVVEEDREEP